MSKFSVVFLIILVILTVAHLFYSIDYNHFFSLGNKGGATGILVGIMGMVSVMLALKAERREKHNT